MQGHLAREKAIEVMNAHVEKCFPTKWISKPPRKRGYKNLTSKRLMRRANYPQIQ